jgi:hypothetical protein
MTVNLETLHLDHGSHSSPEDGHCLLEVVSMLAGQPFNDHPPCVSPVLRSYGIALNDRWDDTQRQRLLPYAPRMLNTAGDGHDGARSYLALDWLIRTFAPAWLDLAGLTTPAAELRALAPVANEVAVQAAAAASRRAEETAAAARAAARAAAWTAALDAALAAALDAARAAARAAARDAAWDAAWTAARDAALAAARDAALAAARDAAWTAARDPAWAALKPTVEQLQASALDLFDRMINPAAAS